MEAIIYTNCFKNKKSGYDYISFLGIIYIFAGLCLLNTFSYAHYIIINGVINLSTGCYYKNKELNREHLILTTRLRLSHGRLENDLIVMRNRTISENNDIWKSSIVFIQESFTCSICCNDRTEKGVFNNCNHYICDFCITNIIKNECPFCRKKIINV